MSNNPEIIEAIKDWVKRQDKKWRFFMGMERKLTKRQVLKLIDKDPEFQKQIIKEINALSVDILMRGKKSGSGD